MQRIIAALSRSGGFLVFFVLEIFCFFLIVTYNQEQRKIYQHSNTIISDQLQDLGSNITQFFYLSADNDSLSGVIAGLREELDNTQFKNRVQRDTGQIELKEGEKNPEQYTYMAARVVDNSTVFTKNYLTLDKGTEDGIDSKMGVFDDDGIVGILFSSNSRYSRVMSILHIDMMISAEVNRNNVFGSLVWKNTRNRKEMNLEYISKEDDIKVGDLIQTSGFGSHFPQGKPIGEVSEVNEGNPGSDFREVKVKLFNDLNQTRHVYIVNNVFKKEQKEIEEEVKNE